MCNDIIKLVYNWITLESDKVDVKSDYYCQTRDIFQARLNQKMEIMKADKNINGCLAILTL